MELHVNSDDSCLSEPKEQSRVGGHDFLSSRSAEPSKQPKITLKNGSLHNELWVLLQVVAWSAEAKLGGLFHNGQITIPLRTELKELVHQQPTKPIETENSTALGIFNYTVK